MKISKWFAKKEEKKFKIGLALGGGGTRGFAHLGALKAFEEHGQYTLTARFNGIIFLRTQGIWTGLSFRRFLLPESEGARLPPIPDGC